MKLITFATIEEAEASLTSFAASRIETGLYASDIGLIAITGIGPFAAYVALANLQIDYDSVLNIGLAGALRPELKLGSMHQVHLCKKHLWHPKGHEAAQSCLGASLPDIIVGSEGLRLTTLDFPLHSRPETLSNTADLVDMEGYGIALSAKLLGKPCTLYKLVSDHCTKETMSQIKNNLGEYSRIIAQYLKNNL